MGESVDNSGPTVARFALAENLAHLMKHHQRGFNVGIEARELAKEVGINARTIKRMLNPDSIHSPRLENLDAVAGFFKIPTWQLLLPRPKALQLQNAETRSNPKSSRPRR